MADKIAIKVEHVSKDFILPHEKVDSIKSLFTGVVKKHHKKSSETQHALEDISFEIKKGEFFGIVGRNGSGKSTMLKILAGIYQPTKGKVTTVGKLVPFIELGVGFNGELTGRENVYLNGAMLGFSRKELDSMYDGIVEFAELERFMDQKLKNYSSGMQVRLAFSMATRAEADILLVDEVLAVGDADFQRKCFDYFKQLKKLKKTVIFVSHDMNAIREYCDRAALIEKSKFVMADRSDKVATAYSRMFIEESKNAVGAPVAKNSKRWGTGDVIFSDVSLAENKLSDSDEELSIKVIVKSKVRAENLAVGFLIKNASGTPIIGTNNHIIKAKIRKLEVDETVELTWHIPNIFSEGNHDITLALENDSAMTDWWEDALSFNVYLERRTPYLVSPLISLDQH